MIQEVFKAIHKIKYIKKKKNKRYYDFVFPTSQYPDRIISFFFYQFKTLFYLLSYLINYLDILLSYLFSQYNMALLALLTLLILYFILNIFSPLDLFL